MARNLILVSANTRKKTFTITFRLENQALTKGQSKSSPVAKYITMVSNPKLLTLIIRREYTIKQVVFVFPTTESKLQSNANPIRKGPFNAPPNVQLVLNASNIMSIPIP